MYPEEITEPIRDELTPYLKELLTVSDVDDVFESETDFLLVVNSVCGCSGSSMRPAVIEVMEEFDVSGFSVFAGVDADATNHARGKISDFEPSSPSVFLFKDGQAVFGLERHDIQGHHYLDVKERLADALLKNGFSKKV